jgi:hypothetical protein
VYVEDFLELYVSQRDAQMGQWTLRLPNLVAGTRTMLLYLLLLIVEATSLILNVSDGGNAAHKFYIYVLLKFLGKRVTFHPHIFCQLFSCVRVRYIV